MNNVWLNDRKERGESADKRKGKKLAKLDVSKRKRDDVMLKNYWKRVENFMIQMVENPIQQNQKKCASINDHKFRDEDPKRFLGNALFIIKGFKDEKERINETIQNFKRLQIEAEKKQHQFRDRNFGSEIQPEMKFGLNNYSIRNKEKFLPNVYGSKDNEEWARNKTWMNKNREQMNDSQVKTHFRGLETYYNKLTDGKPSNDGGNKGKMGQNANFDSMNNQDGGDDDNIGNLGNMDKMNTDGMEGNNYKMGDNDSKDNASDLDENELKKQAVHDFKDSYEMSKLALQKCNKLPQMSHGFIRSGDGHYVSMPHNNIKNNY